MKLIIYLRIIIRNWVVFLSIMTVLICGCKPSTTVSSVERAIQPLLPDTNKKEINQILEDPVALDSLVASDLPTATPPYPTRPRYSPGELVDYVAQTGDTLPGLAVRFNTSVEEILEVNTFIPDITTTMPPGMPMKIPIYHVPLWGSPYQILPDSLFVNGLAHVDFDIAYYVDSQPG